MTKVNEKVQKLFNISLKSLDEEKRQATFVFSDDSIDRYGEKVDQSWDTKNYEKNPIILWGHDPSKAENVIGASVGLTLNDGGKSLMTAQFDDDPHAELIWNKVKKGILRTVSAGFIPHTIEYEYDVPVLKDNELLEISVVAIPANPNAVALDYKAGEMSRKDADFLIKSMRDEADAIEAVTRAADEEQDQAARIAELEQQLADAQKRADDAEAELAAAKESEEEQEDKDDSAKGGDHDQSGAETDIDLDAELSEEDFEALEVPDDEEQK